MSQGKRDQYIRRDAVAPAAGLRPAEGPSTAERGFLGREAVRRGTAAVLGAAAEGRRREAGRRRRRRLATGPATAAAGVECDPR